MKDFIQNRCSMKEAALDLTLSFLRDMKQDEAADTLEGSSSSSSSNSSKRLMIICQTFTY